KATAHRSLISAALAVLPAVMPNKASPKAIVAETLRMLRRFILSLCICVSVGVSGIANHRHRSGRRFAPSRSPTRPATRQRPRPDAEIVGGEVSLCPPRAYVPFNLATWAALGKLPRQQSPAHYTLHVPPRAYSSSSGDHGRRDVWRMCKISTASFCTR